MQPIVVIQNNRNDGPGLFEAFARAHGLSLRVVRRFEGEAVPTDIETMSGLCILGSVASANDDEPDFRALETLVREALGRRVPVIGHCFGGQLLARALGGEITRAPHAEIGWSEIQASDLDWFGADRFPMVQWHYETFSLPPGARLVAQSALCANQAFVVDDIHLGMQFHCEVDRPKLDSWLNAKGEREIADNPGVGVQTADAIRAQADHALTRSATVAHTLYTRWARALRR